MAPRSTIFIFWATISLLVIVHLAIYGALVALAAPELRVQYIPDDGYYYLGLARHFYRLGIWTFDGGVSRTSGFHPLLAYLLVLLQVGFAPGPERFVVLGSALCTALTVVAGLITWAVGVQQRASVLLAALALLLGSRATAFNSMSLMEWPLVVLCALLLCLVYWRGIRRAGWILLLLGALGSLARSDFGLLPGTLFVAALAVALYQLWAGRSANPQREQQRTTPPRLQRLWLASLAANRALRLASAALVGALLGLVLGLLHTYLTTGNLLQSSARIKTFWAAVQGGSSGTAFELPLMAVGIVSTDSTLFFGMLLTAVLGIVALVLRVLRSGPRRRFVVQPVATAELPPARGRSLVLLLAAGLCLIGYPLIYTYSGAVQVWYTANLMVPVGMLLTALPALLAQLSGARWLRWVGAALGVCLIGYNLVRLYPLGPATAPYPHQHLMRQAGLALAEAPLDRRVGAWNAGIIGYYQGGTLINIDGLVNDDIYPYVVQNTLIEYLDRTGIGYVADFDSMFDTATIRRRGGYDTPAFLGRLQALRMFGGNPTGTERVVLYRVVR